MSTRHDEFAWHLYHTEYAAQMIEMKEELDLFITRPMTSKPNLNKEDENGLVFRDNLHANWKDLYNLIYQLRPSKIYEVGCGSGMHLANMHTLLPFCELHGCDISLNQINFGKNELEIDNEIFNNVTIDDFDLIDTTNMVGQYDVVYSHAVLMHVNARRAENMLGNMIELSKKHVVLIERPHVHNYHKILDKLNVNATMTQPSIYGTDLFLIEKL